MTDNITIVSKTVMMRVPKGSFEFRDEFPGTKTISEVLDYIFKCKVDIMKDVGSKYTIKDINIGYKESIVI